MIRLPFELSVVGAAGGLAAALLAWWWWQEALQGRAEWDIPTPRRRFRRCQICTAIYATRPEEHLTICPQCGSYNSQEGSHTP